MVVYGQRMEIGGKVNIFFCYLLILFEFFILQSTLNVKRKNKQTKQNKQIFCSILLVCLFVFPFYIKCTLVRLI